MSRGARKKGQLLRAHSGFEDVIHRNLHGVDQSVGLAGHADDLQKLGVHRIVHALGTGRGRVGMAAILTSIGSGHGNIDHFFGQRVERTGTHHDLQSPPERGQLIGVMCQGAPEIVDVIGAAGGADIVEDGARFGGWLLHQ